MAKVSKGIDISKERALAGMIFGLWLLADILPFINVDIFQPLSQDGPGVLGYVYLYFFLNGLAFLYTVYLFVMGARSLSHVGGKAYQNIYIHLMMYGYVLIGLSIAVISELHWLYS